MASPPFFSEPDRLLHRFGDSARTRFRAFIGEDAEQMHAAVRCGHAIPAFTRMRTAVEFNLQNGWQLVFRLHGRQQAFGHLFRATRARLRALRLPDQIADIFANGVVQLLKPAAESPVLSEQTLQLRWHGDGALCRIRLQTELRHRAGEGFGAGLHLFVYQHEVAASAPGKKRCTKGEAVDFTFDLWPPTNTPGF